jgi:hypothetical protein
MSVSKWPAGPKGQWLPIPHQRMQCKEHAQ